MAIDDYDGLTISIGKWLYAGSATKQIEVVAFDCDYFFDRLPCQDGRDMWKRYPLNAEGRLYYIKADGDVLALKPFQSAGEAKTWGDTQPWAPIEWLDVDQPL